MSTVRDKRGWIRPLGPQAEPEPDSEAPADQPPTSEFVQSPAPITEKLVPTRACKHCGKPLPADRSFTHAECDRAVLGAPAPPPPPDFAAVEAAMAGERLRPPRRRAADAQEKEAEGEGEGEVDRLLERARSNLKLVRSRGLPLTVDLYVRDITDLAVALRRLRERMAQVAAITRESLD
jgi:hypothetical protein